MIIKQYNDMQQLVLDIKSTDNYILADGYLRHKKLLSIVVALGLHVSIFCVVTFSHPSPPMSLDQLNVDLIAQGSPEFAIPSKELIDTHDQPVDDQKIEEPKPIIEDTKSEALPTKIEKPKIKALKKQSVSSPQKKIGLADGQQMNEGMTQYTYGALVIAQIQSKKFYPSTARQQGIRGTAKVRFTINSTGHVSSFAIVEPSGSDILDQAAKDIVLSIELPPPPNGSFSGTTNINFNILR
jgi:TonB family protein